MGNVLRKDLFVARLPIMARDIEEKKKKILGILTVQRHSDLNMWESCFIRNRGNAFFPLEGVLKLKCVVLPLRR